MTAPTAPDRAELIAALKTARKYVVAASDTSGAAWDDLDAIDLILSRAALASEAASPQPVGVEVQNPIEELRLAALTAFPKLDCSVSFASFPYEGPYGVTVFPDDGSRAQVQVAVGIPMEAVIEVMAHELAHVAVGIEANHSPAWEDAFERIHRTYAARALASAKDGEGADG